MPSRRRSQVALAATAAAILGIAFDIRSAAVARAVVVEPAAAASPGRQAQRPATAGTAASGPPLNGQTGTPGDGEEEATAVSPEDESDPLVANGLGSPLCKGALGAGELSPRSSRDCATSGFVAAAAPTGDYGLDVHIDTGVLGISGGGALSAAQDLIITPLWMALVWIVHALVVMLEWCFTIDLLDSSLAGGIGRGLRQTQAAFTEPWLALVLSIASVVAAYNGLIRRRVAETVGEVALVAAMIVGGMWVIADPAGTVGALSGWANRASLGTLAVAARGTPTGPARVLSESMDTVFAAAIEAPWCYLEFGNVSWCRDPSRLDPRLRAAGLEIAAAELALIGCRPTLSSPLPCAERGSAPARGLEHSAQLLREAHSNGAIFLALPANGAARNSINEPDSLLRVLCGSSEASNCRGATAAEAEFRTGGQTLARAGGLLLIAAGMLGMVLLLGCIALRLLAAAVFSLLYLLLAPALVLAPALGESGRVLFRKWVVQLLGAVVAKLVFSFLLGVVLAVLAILANLEALGWWTQWLLMSAFWWTAFLRRHQAIGIADGALGREHAARRSVKRRVGDVLETRRGMALARWAAGRRAGAPEVGGARGGPTLPRALGTGATVTESADLASQQVRRSFEGDLRDARAGSLRAPQIQRGLSARRAQLERVRGERARARSAGDTRRSLELASRAERIEGEIKARQDGLRRVGGILEGSERTRRRSGDPFTAAERRERSLFLDEQASLPAAVLARSGGPRRDYPALASLVGGGRGEYERLDPGGRRAVRLEIDRELSARRALTTTVLSPAGDVFAPPGAASPAGGASEDRRPSRAPRRDPDRAAGIGGGPRDAAAPEVVARREGAGSSVMRDAREVAAGRKRQLGRGRP